MSTIESVPDTFTKIEAQISDLQNDLSDTQNDVNDLLSLSEKDTISELVNSLETTKQEFRSEFGSLSYKLNGLEENVLTDIKNLEQAIDGINNKLFTIAMQLSPTENGIQSIIGMYESIKDENFSIKSSFKSTDVYAVDSITNLTYTAEELTDQKILLSYKSDDQEVFFYGQFNDENQWDGNCIISKERTGGGLNKGAISSAPLFNPLSVFPN